MNTPILSILSGIGGMFGWGIYDFLGSVYTKQIGPFKAFFWSQLAGFGSALLLIFFLPIQFNIPLLIVGLIALAAVLYSAGYLFFFKGFEIGNVSIVAATMNLWAVFTMVFAFLLLGQRLTPVQSVGVFLIIAGVTVASIHWKELRGQGFQLSAGVRETVLGAFFFGVYWNVVEVVSEQIGWPLTTILVKLGIVLFVLIFSLVRRRELGLSEAGATTKWMVLVMGLIEAGASAVVNFGLTIGDAILITPIASALSIVTIGLAILFLKERITRIQGLGIAAAIAGIVVTTF